MANGTKIATNAVAVAARNATMLRKATDRGRSANDTSAHGATAANAQVVFVIVAVFSRPSTGMSTTSDAKANRAKRELIQPSEAQ